MNNLSKLLVFCFLIRVWWIDAKGESVSGIAMHYPKWNSTVDVCPDRGGDTIWLWTGSIKSHKDIKCQCIRCLGDVPQFWCKGKNGKARR